jgi:hypothetical protein
MTLTVTLRSVHDFHYFIGIIDRFCADEARRRQPVLEIFGVFSGTSTLQQPSEMIKKGVCSPLRNQQESIMNGEVVRVVEVFPEIENRFMAFFVRGAYAEFRLTCAASCFECPAPLVQVMSRSSVLQPRCSAWNATRSTTESTKIGGKAANQQLR